MGLYLAAALIASSLVQRKAASVPLIFLSRSLLTEASTFKKKLKNISCCIVEKITYLYHLWWWLDAILEEIDYYLQIWGYPLFRYFVFQENYHAPTPQKKIVQGNPNYGCQIMRNIRKPELTNPVFSLMKKVFYRKTTFISI